MKGGLGQMPLTLWVLIAATILYLYIRRARHGIDQHPGERVTVRGGSPPILPRVPGTPGLPMPTIEIFQDRPSGGGLLR